MGTLCAVEGVFIGSGGGFSVRGVGIWIWNLGLISGAGDNNTVPLVDKRRGEGDEEDVSEIWGDCNFHFGEWYLR